jgi:hypothetical protein
MKKLIDILYRSLFVACLVILTTCSDDDMAPGNSARCNLEACIGDSDLAKAARAVCEDEYTDCLALGAKSEAECAAFATETCTI